MVSMQMVDPRCYESRSQNAWMISVQAASVKRSRGCAMSHAKVLNSVDANTERSIRIRSKGGRSTQLF